MECTALVLLAFFLHIMNYFGELPSYPLTLIRFQEGK
jgi:hypothetical protein